MAAKRGGSDLNHDNWDQEDEPEEQGTFKKATETELKARVIRKPKRRGAGGGEEAKNAFAGFGGFAGAAAKPDGGDVMKAFGFLAKKTGDDSSNSSSSQVFGGAAGNNDSAKPSFVFGSSSLGSSATKPPASTFSFGASAAPAAKATFSFGSGASDEKKESGFGSAFGSTSSAEKKEPAPTVFGNAAFGSKNSEKKDSPKSGFGSAFGSFASKPAEDKKEDKEFNVDDDLMAKFKPKGWSCDVCMVANDTDKEKCISCETPKPGSKPAASASQPTDKPAMSFGKEGGFSFQASSSQTPAAGSGFTFGETKVQEKAPAGGGFMFGKKPDEAEAGEATPVKTVTETNNKNCETPGNEKYLSHLKALNIQMTDWIKKHVDQNPLVILTPVFKDYEKHLKNIGEKYGSTPGKPALDPSPASQSLPPPSLGSTAFGAKPDDDLMAKFKPKAGSWTCDACMVSNVPDKESCVSCETPKPGSKPKEPAAATSTSTFSFGKSGGFSFAGGKDSSSEPPKSGFSFGSSSNSEKPEATGGFSLAANPPPAAAAASSGGFSFAPKATDASKPFSFNASSPFSFAKSAAPAATAAKAEDEDEEDKPPVVEVNAVAEEDSVYSKKCKLFYKKDGAYVEKGVGMLHLKPTDNDKTQLLIRADTNLGNVLLNILLSPQIPTTRVGKNNVMLVCVPNPPIDAKSEETSGPTPMLIRVKNSEDADELKAKVDEMKEK